MDLREFHGRIYGKYNGQLFVFQSTWDSFRPIERVAWNGENYEILDKKYTEDVFDPNYGYGSLEMKALCRKLIQETELDDAKLITDSLDFWKWSGEKEAKWWKDRACVFADPCVSRDNPAWRKYLHYLNVKAKTLRRPALGRFTRRHLVLK